MSKKLIRSATAGTEPENSKTAPENMTTTERANGAIGAKSLTALAAAPADCGKAGKTGGCSSRVLPRTGASPTSASGGESGGESGGCGGESGGGPPGMCMQVLDRSGQVICWADRAMAPGWMRDPKLACPLDLAGGYTLRIFRRGTGGNPCGPGAAYPAPNGAGRPYLLTVAKKKIPPVGSLSAALEIGGGSH